MPVTETSIAQSPATGRGIDATITDIRCHMVRSPRWSETKNVYRDEALLVEVKSDVGVSGWAETNGLMPGVKALVETETAHPRDHGPAHALVGEPLDDAQRLISRLRANTVNRGRSGLGRVAVGAIETALLDLVGKLKGVPAHQLLDSGATSARTSVPAYITVFNKGTFDQVVQKTKDDVDRAKAHGYRAFKIEATDFNTDETEAVQLVEAVRDHVGDDTTLFVDNVFRWKTYEAAYKATTAYQSLGVAFLEDPFVPEAFELSARLYDETKMTIAAGGSMESADRFVAAMELGGVSIVQPGTHVGGLHEADTVCREAAKRGKNVTTFSLCATTLTPAASLQLAAVNPVVSYVEYAPAALFPHLVLRQEIAGPEPDLRDGELQLPPAPGLGVEVDTDAVQRFTISEY
ncbi:mandelate racemase/muconate lactonizing enzyme family protein [Aeromicrobium sp. CTD01-1L150]|uniref:mandelate racemase/muconate lactonizing enzyme family protein n=1 Tax=Aeromicrobium sp. CTD01-1L150 TaxID=3341830 RepID=UPI0035C1BF44